MKKFLFPLLVLLAGFSGPVSAAQLRCEPVAVLELFTSQGCSSCPPADALLREVGDREDIIALAYHVDYWDYIGWKDTFADPAYADYQRAYAAAWESGRIYTPQLVVNGETDVVGSRRHEVQSAVAKADLDLTVMLEAENGMLQVDVAGRAGLPEAVVWLVTFKQAATVAVERGENRGKDLTYTKIVTDRQVLGMWDPQGGAHIKLPLAELLGEGSDGAAIIVQEEIKPGGGKMLPGRILGASSFTS